MLKKINNEDYYVDEHEFNLIPHEEYNNLKIVHRLDSLERVSSILKKMAKILPTKKSMNLLIMNTTHGGFIPLNCFNHYKNVYLHCYVHHENSIQRNVDKNDISNIHIMQYDDRNGYMMQYDDKKMDETEMQTTVVYDYFNDYVRQYQEKEYVPVIIIREKNKFGHYLNEDKYEIYFWENENIYIYVNKLYVIQFEELFKYYLKENRVIQYDNLNHLCVMVKNAGAQFEQMLLNNLPHFDRWTILDTGSTDETIDIINKVLVGKKSGNLYCESFINFSESRNRLLELANNMPEYEDNNCKYLTMLDDTYVINGNLRDFLNEVRGDQYATSFSLYVSSNDCLYGSNRIIRSDSGLKYIYRIHEVITDSNNINVIIPQCKASIIDRQFDYMKARTFERKQLDLKLLFEELEDNPNNPRIYYYLAQTYNTIDKFEEAYYYFLKRIEFINCGFVQERYDSAFEAGRIANFKLNKSWDDCLKLYEKAIQIDDGRPDAYYFVGIHYYHENNFKLAYKYLKIGFELGFPSHCQYSLKPTISYHFLPKFLTRICYFLNDNKEECNNVGFQSSKFFLENNLPNADDYAEILSWNAIYLKLIEYKGIKKPSIPININNDNYNNYNKNEHKEIICFVADGGFNQWSGSSINKIGVGGSETYIIEMSRHILQYTGCDVYVFCNCSDEEVFEGVKYKPLSEYAKFIYTNYVKHVIISRYSEYLPLTYDGWSENVYLVVHDLTPSGLVIPLNNKLKNIFCLTEWHVNYMNSIYPNLSHLLVPFYYGIDEMFYVTKKNKIPNSFIYSSFANRGLLVLLKMWPKIYNLNNNVSLNIYCDLDNNWVNSVAGEQIIEIKNMLEKYKMENETSYNITYHGWVSKSILANAWKTADIWFYPCTFTETFCLTALEASASNTLAICNDLGALQNVVADRGIIISGDPSTLEWQETALSQLSIILNNDTNNIKKTLTDNNFTWARCLTWQNRAIQLFDNYLNINKLEYKGMYNWTNDIPSGSKNDFLEVIKYFNTTHKLLKLDKIKVLEIGTYTGISLINIVKLIPNSIGYGLDKWNSYDENNLLENMDELQIMKSFDNNVAVENMHDKIIKIQGSSHDELLNMVKTNIKFDFIYVDGSHLLMDCYLDLVLSWELLNVGGILAIDDYLYKCDEILLSPFEAVNYFLKLYEGKYILLMKNYRVFLEKIS